MDAWEVPDAGGARNAGIPSDPAAAAEEIGRLYPAVYRRFHVSRRPLQGSDLTLRMVAVLQHLAASGPLTVGELATHLRLSMATTTELTTRIEERGLIDRMRDERDRRRVYLWLTGDGRLQARRYAQAHARVLADDALLAAVRRMEPADTEALIHGLHALLIAAEDGRNRSNRHDGGEAGETPHEEGTR